MKTKLLLTASAAILSLGMGSANAAPVQLTTAQMDNVSAGQLYRSRQAISVRTGDVKLQIQVSNITQVGVGNIAAVYQSQQIGYNSYRGLFFPE